MRIILSLTLCLVTGVLLSGKPTYPEPFPAYRPYGCSVTSTGTVDTGDAIITLTITVTGPCDARLAQKMRDAIEQVRAQFK